MIRKNVLAASLLAFTTLLAGVPAQAAPNQAAQVFTFPLEGESLHIYSEQGEQVGSIPFVEGNVRLVVQQVPDPGSEVDRVILVSSLNNVVASDGTYTCRLTGSAREEFPAGRVQIRSMVHAPVKTSDSCPFAGNVVTVFVFRLIAEVARDERLQEVKIQP
jgi:hypothetical protein